MAFSTAEYASMIVLDAVRTAAALPYAELVPAIARAARELAAGSLRAPERMVVGIDPNSVLLCMPAIAADIGVTKLITVHGDNPRQGRPAIQGDVIVFDAASGERLVMLDGPTVTARRTAAVTLLGVERLAPRQPASAILIGTGAQAATHAEALAEHFGIRTFWIAARSEAAAMGFCARLHASQPGVKAQPLDLATLQQDLPPADLLIALTSARSPVIPSELPPHMLAVGVGAFKPEMAEFPPALLHARRIVVDHREGARHEAGDLIQAGVDWTRVSELAEVLDTVHGGALLPVFKTVGQAAWDLAAARVARRHLGT